MPPFSFSWELDGPIASLLGTGVMLLTVDFLNAGFFGGALGLGIALAALPALAFKPPLEELGVAFAGAFVKKFVIDR
jgi:hypothetical protein